MHQSLSTHTQVADAQAQVVAQAQDQAHTLTLAHGDRHGGGGGRGQGSKTGIPVHFKIAKKSKSAHIKDVRYFWPRFDKDETSSENC